MKKEEKGIAKATPTTPVVQSSSPQTVIDYAISKGAAPETLEKYLILQERWEANQARKEYNRAMSEVHRKMLPVTKVKKNAQTSSKYAGLEDVIKVVQPIYSGEGFSVCFYEGDTEKPEHVRICMDIIHSLGHKETYHYDMPLDGKGIKGNVNMTPIHGKSSSVSYGRRYLQCMVFNLATDDDDGNAAGKAVECISDDEQHTVANLIIAAKSTKDKLCAAFKIDSLAKLPKNRYNEALINLEAKRTGKVNAKK